MKSLKISIILIELVLSILYSLFTENRDALTEFFMFAIILTISVAVSLVLVYFFRKDRRWAVFIATNGFVGPVIFLLATTVTPSLTQIGDHGYDFEDKYGVKCTIYCNTYSKTCEICRWYPVGNQFQVKTVDGSIIIHRDTMFLLFDKASIDHCERDSVRDYFRNFNDSKAYILGDSIFTFGNEHYRLLKAY